MFKSASIALFLASASAVDARDLCYDNYDTTIKLDLGREGCTWKAIFNPIRDQFRKNREENPVRCKGGPRNEIMALTGTESEADAKDFVYDMCAAALKSAMEEFDTDAGWGTVEGADVNLGDFFKGEGFLNTETGNFENDVSKFNQNTDAFIYIGDDPRLNDHYPTSEQSFAAGKAIDELYTNESRTAFMGAPTDGFQCQSNTAMCCWHRDRQYFDNNGNCGHKDCANQAPGDNTDLCWTENSDGEVFPFPGDETEGNLHCHGLAWSNDYSGYDINTSGRYNTLFYISLYDHLKERGYTESFTNDPNIPGDQPMCGCVEEMNPVARADCSEIVGTTKYTVSIVPDEEVENKQNLIIEKVDDTFELAFQACEGIKFVEDYGPTDYAEDVAEGDRSEIKRTSNDLAAFVFKQYLKEKMGEEQMDTVKETLVGFENRNIQKNDGAREAECERAFNEKFPGVDYVNAAETAEE